MTGKFNWPRPVEGLSAGLDAVDELMITTVGKDGLGAAAAELIKAGGKRMRPALTLTAAALGRQVINAEAVQAAAAIELVHLASLVHDDILDNSHERRNAPSTAAGQGSGFALLLGDFLLAKALSLAAATAAEIAVMISAAIAGMAEGEALELTGIKPAKPLSRDYIMIIRLKTATLFAAATAAGAICGNLPPKTVKALQLYGEDFGVAFQLADDIVDQRILLSQRVDTLKEISRRIKAGERRLTGLESKAADCLKALPQAYFDWATAF